MINTPKLSNDCFALPPGITWTPVDDALNLLEKRLRTIVGTESIPVVLSDGRILAGSLIAPRSSPPFTNSAVDGYAFKGELSTGQHCFSLVEGRSLAGSSYKGLVRPNKAIRILTGAALPEGTDTVVLEEDVNIHGSNLFVEGPLKRGANVRVKGEDVLEGSKLVERGHKIQPQDIGRLISVGVADVVVFRSLKVAIISTGTELCEIGDSPKSGQSFDANRPMLKAILRRWGMDVVDIGIIKDHASLVRQALNDATRQADVVITTAGASAGDEDYVSAALKETGQMSIWRLAVKPGRPLALGMWNGVPVFGLPGNPVAAFVCTLIFARPSLLQLAGAGFEMPRFVKLPAGFSKIKKGGRREYLRARVRQDTIEVFASEGSGRISGLTWAEGLVELPDEAMEIKPGDLVNYISYSSFGI